MSVRPEDLAKTMMDRHRERRCALDRRADELRERVVAEVRAILAEGRARQAWIIGSLAWGGFDVRSDVDLVFEGVGADALDSLWARLSERLQLEPDVLRLEELSDDFRERVLAQGMAIDVA